MLNKKQLGLVVVGLRDLKQKNLWNENLTLWDLLEAGLKVDAQKQIAKAKAKWKAIEEKEAHLVGFSKQQAINETVPHCDIEEAASTLSKN